MQPSKAIVKTQARRTTPFLGEQDTAKLVWSGKTHRSASEAFRDAEYAMAICTFKSDAKLTWDFIKGSVAGMVIVGVPLFIVVSLALEIAK